MTDQVAIIGANGFVGRALTQALANRGVRVIAASRRRIDIAHELVTPVAGEFRQPDDFAQVISGCRTVVHLATTSTPGSSAGRPLHEVTTNLHVTAALLEAMHPCPDAQLLYLSSGGSLYVDTSTAPSDEHAPVRPRSYHGAGKLAAEHFISAWCDQLARRAVILRPSNIYGPGQPQRAGFGIIPAAMGAIASNRVLPIWGDGSARRDYVFVDDLVRLCTAALEAPMQEGATIVNACSNHSVSLNELLSVIEQVTGRPVQRTYSASRSVDASCIAMDASLANRLYGWRHETSLPEGVTRTWAAFGPTTPRDGTGAET